jgi:hypothetical protein
VGIPVHITAVQLLEALSDGEAHELERLSIVCESLRVGPGLTP